MKQIGTNNQNQSARPLLAEDLRPLYFCQHSWEYIRNFNLEKILLMTKKNGYWKKTKKGYLFTDAEGDVLVLDHVGDLASHGEEKENNPVAKQNRPEDRDIKDREERHEESYAEGLSHGVPEKQIQSHQIKETKLGNK